MSPSATISHIPWDRMACHLTHPIIMSSHTSHHPITIRAHRVTAHQAFSYSHRTACTCSSTTRSPSLMSGLPSVPRRWRTDQISAARTIRPPIPHRRARRHLAAPPIRRVPRRRPVRRRRATLWRRCCPRRCARFITPRGVTLNYARRTAVGSSFDAPYISSCTTAHRISCASRKARRRALRCSRVCRPSARAAAVPISTFGAGTLFLRGDDGRSLRRYQRRTRGSRRDNHHHSNNGRACRTHHPHSPSHTRTLACHV